MNHSLADAEKVALELRELFMPYCDKIKIAGSIARRKPQVNDIDIVVLINNINKFGMALYELCKIGISTEDRKKTFHHKGFKIELWIPQRHDYQRILTIRQGSADWVHHNVAKRWTLMGWCGTEEGLRLKSECTQMGKRWKCVVPNPTIPPAWETQEEFFNWLGIPLISPEHRN